MAFKSKNIDNLCLNGKTVKAKQNGSVFHSGRDFS